MAKAMADEHGNPVVAADQLLRRGAVAKAQALLRPHLEANPYDARARYLWGMARLREGDAVDAERIFRGILGQSPRNYGAAFSLGLCLEQQGRSDAAADAYQVACLLKPDYGPARAKLASLGTSLKDANQQGERQQHRSGREPQSAHGSTSTPGELRMNEFFLPANDAECAEYKRRYAAKINAKFEANRDLLSDILEHEVPALIQKISETQEKRLLMKGGNDVLFAGVTNLLRLLRDA
ncbi:hypothetical protein CKO31_22990 [Thiohalocapsa halophila]|uniref:Tetratricopeptide repeat protein n=1 Tax=Thiohalocapsa halophila TaxID=69359 RepID=A0ABS1CNP7_9GAMM|nr:tetratricopeptide repeat protein [Thiohalocapsa halophila]MBK1633558.1 hypothetical protein [Thiohalocapsa halophila]